MSLNPGTPSSSDPVTPVADSSKLSFIYTNADSLGNKINELHSLVDVFAPDIICITEALPKFRNHNLEPPIHHLPGFNGFHATTGRGISVFVDNKIKCEEVCIPVNFAEVIWLKISLEDKKNLLLGCLYRSPNSGEANNNMMLELLEEANNWTKDHLIIVGDFNIKEINWTDNIVNTGHNHLAYRTYDKVNDLFLDQLVKEPTRHRQGEQPSTLDWILTDSADIIVNLSIEAPLGVRGDHNVIHFDFSIPPNSLKQPIKFNLYKGNYSAMVADLKDYNWEALLSHMSCQQSWNTFSKNINEAMTLHIPKFNQNKTKNKKLWMSKDTRLTIKAKNRAWNKYKKHKTAENWTAFTQKRNEANRTVSLAKRAFEQKIAGEIKSNPKQFWRYVNSKSPKSRDLPTMQDQEGVKYTSDEDKAELFNQYFANVFTKEDRTLIPALPTEPFDSSIDSIEINPPLVEKYLRKLNIGKAAGPDEFFPRMLHEIREAICEPLSIIYNKSLVEGQLPTDWKLATVKPIYKKGKKNMPSNYRPVSLTSVCCKIMERMVRDKVFDYLETNELFSKDQHGFRQGRSCTTQLLDIMEIWTKILDEGKAFDCVYLDFAKAFDKVPHARLGYKIEHYGIKGSLLNWIKNFLNNRHQAVTINASTSKTLPVSSGIPQGSVLGPLLFVIYINDLPQEVESQIKIFADDTKIFRTLEANTDSTTLQQDLYKILEWSNKWLLPFNTDKCTTVHYGPNNPNHTYEMNSSALTQSNQEKDLGITFDQNLKFAAHIRNMVAKANGRVGLLRRNFSNMSPSIFLPLYKSLVRPLLEYGSCIWNPALSSHNIEIEKVQHRATKLVQNIKNQPYPQRLRYLKLDSLKFRRRRCDMLQVFRILKGIDKLEVNKFFEFHDGPNTRGHPLKLKKMRVNSNQRLHSFSQRIVNDWNNLSKDTVTKTDLNSFKTSLIQEWADHPERYEDL